MDQVSFLPEDFKTQRAQRRTNLICVGLFVLVMAGIVSAYAVTDRQRAQVRQQLAQVEGQFEEAAKRLDQLDELQRQKQQIIRKASVTGVLLERVPRTLVLSELINRMPEKVGLIQLRFDTQTLRMPSVARTALDRMKSDKARADAAAEAAAIDMPQVRPTEVTLQLTGVAPTDVELARYMSQLSHSPLFTDLNLSFSQEMKVESVTMRKFAIAMKIKADVHGHQIEPLRVRRDGGESINSRMTSFPLGEGLIP